MTTPVYEYTDLDAARDALAAGFRDTFADNPDLTEEDIGYDMVEMVARQCDTETAFELCRTELAYVPVALLRDRPDVAAYERRHPIVY